MTEPMGAAAAVEGARFRLAPAALAWCLAGLAVVLFAGCLALLFLTRDYSQAAYGSGGAVAAIVALAVGTVVALRQPGNPIGWLLLGWAALVPAAGIAVLYSVLDYRVHGGTLPLGRAAVLLQGIEFGVAVLAGLGLVLLATHVLPVSSPVAVAGATLVVAALFNPLRHRVQRMVDHRFNRTRYNTQQTVAAFADRLKDPADLDAVRSELLGAVQQALEPARAWVWISGGRS